MFKFKWIDEKGNNLKFSKFKYKNGLELVVERIKVGGKLKFRKKG